MNITKTNNQTVTYCVSESDHNAPEDESRDIHEFFNVRFKGKEIVEIKLPSTQINYLGARTLYMLTLLLNQLESEGYKLSYEDTITIVDSKTSPIK
jgi:hypothetical protein